MTDVHGHADVRVGPQGRVVIPSAIRKELGIVDGETLVARVDNGRLVIEKREAVLSRVFERFCVIPPGISLADELIAERREEARQENTR
jgi:AbrB family looped-hinge helix DNA binding protein